MTIIYYKLCICKREGTCSKKCTAANKPQTTFCNTASSKTKITRKKTIDQKMRRIVIKETAKDIMKFAIIPLYCKNGKLKPPPVNIIQYHDYVICDDYYNKYNTSITNGTICVKISTDSVTYKRWRTNIDLIDFHNSILIEVASLWEHVYEIQQLTQATL